MQGASPVHGQQLVDPCGGVLGTMRHAVGILAGQCLGVPAGLHRFLLRIGEDGIAEADDDVVGVAQGVQRGREPFGYGLSGAIAVGHGEQCVLSGGGGRGRHKRVQVRHLQPGRLFDGGQQGVQCGGVRGGVQADEQVAFRIGLFHLIERALRHEPGQTAARGAFRCGGLAGGLALRQSAENGLRREHGDIAGIGGDDGGVGAYDAQGHIAEIAGGDHGVIPLPLGGRQRLLGPRCRSLPGHGVQFGFVVAERLPVLRQGGCGVPVLRADAGAVVPAGIGRRIGGDVESGGLHDGRTADRHPHGIQVCGVGDDLHPRVVVQQLGLFLDLGFAGLAQRDHVGVGVGTVGEQRGQVIRVDPPLGAGQRQGHGDVQRRGGGTVQSFGGTCQECVRLHAGAVGMEVDAQRLGTPLGDGRQHGVVGVDIDGDGRGAAGGDVRGLDLGKDLRCGDADLVLRPLLDIGA